MDIVNIRTAKGEACASPAEAVEKYMCPGPCSPDCALYPTVQLGDGRWAHMCHPENVRRFPEKILGAIGASYGVKKDGQSGQDAGMFVAVMSSPAVRDVQTCKDLECDPTESEWIDVESPQLYLGLFYGFRDDVIAKAAEYGITNPANIQLIPVSCSATYVKHES